MTEETMEQNRRLLVYKKARDIEGQHKILTQEDRLVIESAAILQEVEEIKRYDPEGWARVVKKDREKRI